MDHVAVRYYYDRGTDEIPLLMAKSSKVKVGDMTMQLDEEEEVDGEEMGMALYSVMILHISPQYDTFYH